MYRPVCETTVEDPKRARKVRDQTCRPTNFHSLREGGWKHWSRLTRKPLRTNHAISHWIRDTRIFRAQTRRVSFQYGEAGRAWNRAPSIAIRAMDATMASAEAAEHHDRTLPPKRRTHPAGGKIRTYSSQTIR